MRALTVAVIIAAAAAMSVPRVADAAKPSAEEIASRMHLVLWPDRPSTCDLTFTVSAEHDTTKLTGIEARNGREGAAKRMVIVILAPPGLKGTAWLVQPGPSETVQWVFDPNVRRVRKILPVQGFEAFLTSEYTYADLGLVDLHATYKVLAEEPRDGVDAYELQATPRDPRYYSRIVTWVAADTYAPLAREYYDAAGALWKAERFGALQNVDGTPTILERRIEDKQTGGSTTMTATDLRYDAKLPDDLFDPMKLSVAAKSPAWK